MGALSPVVDYTEHPVFVKSDRQICCVLLVAADSCYEADFLEA